MGTLLRGGKYFDDEPTLQFSARKYEIGMHPDQVDFPTA
jgi:hypothetical protein